jgi:hypothetical protein
MEIAWPGQSPARTPERRQMSIYAMTAILTQT